jgi:hypothetical protein
LYTSEYGSILVEEDDIYTEGNLNETFSYLILKADGCLYIRRNPAQIKAAGGFYPMADLNKLTPDTSLYNHCKGEEGDFKSNPDDGYIATSASFEVALDWIDNPLDGEGVVYRVATDANLVDCQLTLGRC